MGGPLVIWPPNNALTANGKKTTATGAPHAYPPLAGQGKTRPRAQSAGRHQLLGALHRAGIYLLVSDNRPARFRSFRDRLCARAFPGRVEVAQALLEQLPQLRRLS